MSMILMYLGLAVLLGGGIWLSYYLKRKREEAMAAFALAQGWQALSNDGVTLSKFLPEALTGKGENPQYDMAYGFKIGQSDAVIFQYQYEIHTTDAQGRSETQIYSFGVLTFSVGPTFTPLYIQKHTFLGGLGGYEHQEKLQVEGDFNKHFEVYTPQGKEVEALSLLTPDIMALMEDAGRDFSVQVIGQMVSVFGDDKYIGPQHALEMVGYVQQLAAKLSAKQ